MAKPHGKVSIYKCCDRRGIVFEAHRSVGVGQRNAREPILEVPWSVGSLIGGVGCGQGVAVSVLGVVQCRTLPASLDVTFKETSMPS
jgi:hypothetical protein